MARLFALVAYTALLLAAHALATSPHDPDPREPYLYFSERLSEQLAADATSSEFASRALATAHVAVARAFSKQQAAALSPKMTALLPASTLHAIFYQLYSLCRTRYELTPFLNNVFEEAARFDEVEARIALERGRAAAQEMLADRVSDGSLILRMYKFKRSPGRWRPVPPLYLTTRAGPSLSCSQSADWQGPAGITGWGRVAPFNAGPIPFSLGGPPSLDGMHYALAVNLTRSHGGAHSAYRTPEDEERVVYCRRAQALCRVSGGAAAAGGALARARRLPVAEAARLMALVAAAVADAQVETSRNEDLHDAWRPVSAIRAGIPSNPFAGGLQDGAWRPFMDAFSREYPSGHAARVAAAFRAAELFFGTDRLAFNFTPPAPPPSRPHPGAGASTSPSALPTGGGRDSTPPRSRSTPSGPRGGAPHRAARAGAGRCGGGDGGAEVVAQWHAAEALPAGPWRRPDPDSAAAEGTFPLLPEAAGGEGGRGASPPAAGLLRGSCGHGIGSA
eukprot:tig00021537_g22259.t1